MKFKKFAHKQTIKFLIKFLRNQYCFLIQSHHIDIEIKNVFFVFVRREKFNRRRNKKFRQKFNRRQNKKFRKKSKNINSCAKNSNSSISFKSFDSISNSSNSILKICQNLKSSISIEHLHRNLKSSIQITQRNRCSKSSISIFEFDQNLKYNKSIQITSSNFDNIMSNRALNNIELYVIITQNDNIIKSMNEIKNIFDECFIDFNDENLIRKSFLKK